MSWFDHQVRQKCDLRTVLSSGGFENRHFHDKQNARMGRNRPKSQWSRWWHSRCAF